MEIAGRVFVVTGASSGLGEALARRLLGAGARVVLAARRLDRLERVLDEAGHAERALAMPTDLLDTGALQRLVDATVERFGGVHGLVHCAGAARMASLDDMSPESLEALVRVNLVAPLLLTRLALPHLRRAPPSLVVMVSSLSTVARPLLQAPYIASKAGLEALADSLRRDLDGTGVDVLLARPGMIDTPMIADFRVAASRLGIRPPMAILTPAEAAEMLFAGIQAGRREVIVGRPADRGVALLGRWAPWLIQAGMRRLRPQIERLAAAEAEVRAERESSVSRR